MKEKIKNNKPYRIYFLYSIIIIFIISFVISEGIFFQNNAFATGLLKSAQYKSGCVPPNEPDPETGCKACGNDARTAYEQCRQVFFLKQQNQILQSQKGNEQKSQELQGLLDSQQKQVKELIQQVDSRNQKINALTVSLRNSNMLNIGLALILGIFLICLISIFIKKIWKKKIKI